MYSVDNSRYLNHACPASPPPPLASPPALDRQLPGVSL